MSAGARIVLADDHGLVLDGLRALLSTEPGLDVVGTCVDGHEALELLMDTSPDLLILDLRMPGMDGLTVMDRLAQAGRLPPTVLMGAVIEAWQMIRALRLGARGILPKDEAPGRMLECVRAVLSGERWISPAGRRGLRQVDLLADLTQREREIALLVAGGLSNKRVAARLAIAPGTVKAHLHRVFRKLGVNSRVQLVLELKGAGSNPADPQLDPSSDSIVPSRT